MHFKMTAWTILLVFTSIFSSITNGEEKPATLPAIKILMIGDSTMSTYKKAPKNRPDLTGWGQVFGKRFNKNVTVINHAKSGRSTKSFIQEGHWKKALKVKADYLIIQFGHNDSHPKTEQKATDAKTDFRDYLRTYIDESRKAGMKPILVTPMTRRRFRNGKIWTTLRPYAEAVLIVGQEKNVPVIDLHKSSVALHNKLGEEGSAFFNLSKKDLTHFTRKGAEEIVTLVVEEIKEKVPALKPYLKP